MGAMMGKVARGWRVSCRTGGPDAGALIEKLV